MKKNTSKTILFVTGAFISHSVWEPWIRFFEDQGYFAIAPPWPYKDASADVLRSKHPDVEIGSLKLEELIEFYIKIILEMDELPTIIGHGLGGLIAQILIARRFGTAAVAMHSIPPIGIYTHKISFYKSLFRAMGILSRAKSSYMISLQHWQREITPGMETEEQKASFDRYATPESKLVIRDILTDAARVDFRRLHAPLLIISGSSDSIIPASVNYSNFKSYSNKHSLTSYKEFEGANHFMPGQNGWNEKASFIADWLKTI